MFKNLWVESYRPKTLDDLVLTSEELNFFKSLKEEKEIPNLLFAGSPGTGKTSLAKIIVNDILKCQYLYINASDENGIDTIRSKVIGFSQTRSFTVLSRKNSSDQFKGFTWDVEYLKENGWKICMIGAFLVKENGVAQYQ